MCPRVCPSARRYPTRAWRYSHSLTDVKVKALLNRYTVMLLEQMSPAGAAPVFSTLDSGGVHENYLDEARLLTMRMLLEAWGFSCDAHCRQELYDTSIALQYFSLLLPGMLAHLPKTARILEDKLETDAGRVAERAISRLPIQVS